MMYLLVFHWPCMDGKASMLKLVRDLGLKPKQYQLYGCSPRKFSQLVPEKYNIEDVTVYYLDNCPSVEAVENLQTRGAKNVHVLDHHIGNVEVFKTLPKVDGDIRILNTDNTLSGVGVVGQHTAVSLCPAEELVQSRDLFNFTDVWTEERTEVFYAQLGTEMDLEKYVVMTEQQLIDYIEVDGAAIQSIIEERNKNYLMRTSYRNWVPSDLEAVKIAFSNVLPVDVSSYGSYIRKNLPEEHSDTKMLMTVNVKFPDAENDCYLWAGSFRAIEEGFDCLPYAKYLGGGGHKAACGFSQMVQPTELQELKIDIE